MQADPHKFFTHSRMRFWLPQLRFWGLAIGLPLLTYLGCHRYSEQMMAGSYRHLDAMQRITKIELQLVQQALTNFRHDTGRFPTNEEGFDVLLTSPTGPGPLYGNGPYLVLGHGFNNVDGKICAADPRDPDVWGHPYMYETRHTASGIGFAIFSYGPRGAPFGSGAIIATEDSGPKEVK